MLGRRWLPHARWSVERTRLKLRVPQGEMSLHALGGPSKHNAQEEIWRQRLEKEANPAKASTVTYGDSRISAGFGTAQRTSFVPTVPLIPRAGDYR